MIIISFRFLSLTETAQNVRNKSEDVHKNLSHLAA